MLRYLAFILIPCFLFYSCRSTKKIQTAIAKKDSAVVTIPVVSPHEDTLAFIRDHFKLIQSKYIEFTTFSAKVDVDYQDVDGKKYNVNAHIRMYKDSAIWVSITAILGIEGLRAYITRDSLKLLDKQNKIYIARSVSFLQEVTALPLGLSSLQQLIIGNPVFFDSSIVSYRKMPGSISFLNLGEFFKHLYTIGDADMLAQSSKLDDIDEQRNRTCYLTYGDYEDKKGFPFSTRRTINVSEKRKLDIKLNFKQYDFNETLSFPFSIPKNYKRN